MQQININKVGKIYNYKASNPICNVIIVHGSKENCSRYSEFASELSGNNINVYSYDHISHGERENYNDKYHIDGYEELLLDLKEVINFVNSDLPGVPICLFGHSMGSLICRNYLIDNKTDILILSGTTNPNKKLTKNILAVVNRRIEKKGALYSSKLFDRIIFDFFTLKVLLKTGTKSWLSSDKQVQVHFDKEVTKGRIFDLGYIRAMLMLALNCIELEEENDIQTLIITGKLDPVSNFTKEIKLVETKFVNNKRIDYENSRHEILNDLEKNDVTIDVIDYIESVINK